MLFGAKGEKKEIILRNHLRKSVITLVQFRKKIFKEIKMSGRGRGGVGLGRFVRQFDENETMPLFLRILPKKYHKEFIDANLDEQSVHDLVNRVFQGGDVRDDLKYFLDIPPRFRLVNVKETKPVYEKLCKEYEKSRQKQKVIVKQQQKVVVAKQKTNNKKLNLKCECQTIL